MSEFRGSLFQLLIIGWQQHDETHVAFLKTFIGPPGDLPKRISTLMRQ
jgi:hypothetical protein